MIAIKDLPTIRQIIAESYGLNESPMDADEAHAWFTKTTALNRRKREEREQKQRTAER